MSKTLFDVLLPATGKRYDFWVPNDMPMQQVSELIAEAMQVAEPSFYRKTPNAMLMYMPTGQIPDMQASAVELGFTDGDRFALM